MCNAEIQSTSFFANIIPEWEKYGRLKNGKVLPMQTPGKLSIQYNNYYFQCYLIL